MRDFMVGVLTGVALTAAFGSLLNYIVGNPWPMVTFEEEHRIENVTYNGETFDMVGTFQRFSNGEIRVDIKLDKEEPETEVAE